VERLMPSPMPVSRSAAPSWRRGATTMW
jgi:hypothetical protein